MVIRDVQDVAAVWRNTMDLSFDPFVKAVMHAFGISPTSLDLVFADPQIAISDQGKRDKSLLIMENPQRKCYMNLERDWFKTQLLAPERLQRLQDSYTIFLKDCLSWENLSQTYIVPSQAGTGCKTISLKLFARHTVSYCGTSTFFGNKLLQVDPGFLRNYQEFEEGSWKIFYRLPMFLARSSHAAKARAIAGLERYLSLPAQERSELSWLFQTMNAELHHLSVPPRDVAGIVMIIIWA